MIFLTVVACEICRNSYFDCADQRTGSGVWWELWVICCTLPVAMCSSNTLMEYKQHELAENVGDEKKIHKAEARAAIYSLKSLSSRSLSNRRSASASSTVSSQESAIPTIISRVSLDHGAFASQKPSPGTCFACRRRGPWRASCPLYQHSFSAAGKQWLAQYGFEGVAFSCIYCLSRCVSCLFTHTLFRFAILQIPNLLLRQSLI